MTNQLENHITYSTIANQQISPSVPLVGRRASLYDVSGKFSRCIPRRGIYFEEIWFVTALCFRPSLIKLTKFEALLMGDQFLFTSADKVAGIFFDFALCKFRQVALDNLSQSSHHIHATGLQIRERPPSS